MRRSASFAVFLILLVASLAAAQSAAHPQDFTPEGAAPVPLAGQATGNYLLAMVELYAVALYAEGGPDRSRLVSPQTAKALRIEITYKEELKRRATIDWRRELIPALDGPATTHLVGTFAPLQHGDIVIVEYAPSRGTTVRVNEKVAVSRVNHDVMLAFLDHWVGQRPLSEEIKQALIGRP